MKTGNQEIRSHRDLQAMRVVIVRILAVIAALILLSPLLIIIYLFVGYWLLACDSMPLKTWTNIGGLDFAYVAKDCATLGSAWTHELQVGVHGWPWKERIFLVEPADDNLVPSIAVEDGAIVVDLTAVDDIIMAKNEWRGRPVRYHIGRIKYPHPLSPSDIELNLK